MATPKETEVLSSRFTSWEDYTPDQLRVMACEMERDKVLSVHFRAEEEYGSATFRCYDKRIETQAEADARAQKEERERKQRDDWDRAHFERLKKKFERADHRQ